VSRCYLGSSYYMFQILDHPSINKLGKNSTPYALYYDEIDQKMSITPLIVGQASATNCCGARETWGAIPRLSLFEEMLKHEAASVFFHNTYLGKNWDGMDKMQTLAKAFNAKHGKYATLSVTELRQPEYEKHTDITGFEGYVIVVQITDYISYNKLVKEV
jgi:hypothetical protein